MIVGSGTISTEAPEFAFTISPDGKTAYFNRASADRRRLTIMRTTWNGALWSAPEVASFSGQYADVDPSITPDGRFLLFSSDRPRADGSRGGFDNWSIALHRSSATPTNLGSPPNSDSTDIYVTQSRDGLTVFSSNRFGPMRVYSSRQATNSWSPPVPIGFGADSTGGNPSISPSGKMMVIVRTVPERGSDLFVSCRTRDGWSAAMPLAGANSTFSEFAPSFDPKERTLYFTSERPGIAGAQPPGVRPPGDIYALPVHDWCAERAR